MPVAGIERTTDGPIDDGAATCLARSPSWLMNMNIVSTALGKVCGSFPRAVRAEFKVPKAVWNSSGVDFQAEATQPSVGIKRVARLGRRASTGKPDRRARSLDTTRRHRDIIETVIRPLMADRSLSV